MEQGKLVITGMGAVTPIGIGVPEYWNNLVRGSCGIAPITRFDATDLPVRIAAEVRNFDAARILPRELARAAAPFMHFSFAAAGEALRDSGIGNKTASERIGIVMGTALSGVSTVAHTQEAFGASLTLDTACSSGGDAMMTAAMLLRAGEADAVLAVAGESALCPIIVSSLAQAKALSRANDCPELACRPFDRERDGFVIGEGGGAVLIETEAHALARGANIRACLAGYANTNDAHHITAPDPSGSGAASCMRKALARAGFMPGDIGYINAHGTSTPLGDMAETQAVKAVFGGIATAPPISSTKGATGHLMGAGGITEVIACVLAISEGMLPPTLHYSVPDPACDLDYVPNRTRPARISAAMSNSLGFGGQNSCIIVSRYP